jgi:hypothetical protein
MPGMKEKLWFMSYPRTAAKLALPKVGNGPALVIVSGALAHRELNGDTALVRKLMDHFSVYTYDRRGRGESSDTKPYAVDREIEDIEALIDHAGGKAYLQPGDAASFFLSAIGTPPKVLEGMKNSPDWEAIKRIDFTLVYATYDAQRTNTSSRGRSRGAGVDRVSW